MADIDEYASGLLESAKRFLEKARAAGLEKEAEEAFLTAALLTGVSSLEAHINSIAEEMSHRPGLGVLESSILGEREVRLEKGRFELTSRLKMYRLEDRLEFLFRHFAKNDLPRKLGWWANLQGALDLRNKVVHPWDNPKVSVVAVERALQAILDCLESLYRGVFKKGFPGYKRKLDSTKTF